LRKRVCESEDIGIAADIYFNIAGLPARRWPVF
jgi:hypothetical protein